MTSIKNNRQHSKQLSLYHCQVASGIKLFVQLVNASGKALNAFINESMIWFAMLTKDYPPKPKHHGRIARSRQQAKYLIFYLKISVIDLNNCEQPSVRLNNARMIIYLYNRKTCFDEMASKVG